MACGQLPTVPADWVGTAQGTAWCQNGSKQKLRPFAPPPGLFFPYVPTPLYTQEEILFMNALNEKHFFLKHIFFLNTGVYLAFILGFRPDSVYVGEGSHFTGFYSQ